MTEVELQPDAGEVLQEEPPDDYRMSTVPVCVTEIKGPVRTQALPRKSGTTLTRTVGTTPVRLLTADHYRARALLVSDTAFRFAYSHASAQGTGTMALWPANVPLELEATAEVWALVDTDTADVSVVTERWAVGE